MTHSLFRDILISNIEEKGTAMNRKTLRDKILGCFNGKNVGGTLGAPLEGKTDFSILNIFFNQI